MASLATACLTISETGQLKTLVAGVIDWRGPAPPVEGDLASKRVLAQGMTRIEAFTEIGSQILGNTNPTVPSDLASNYRDFHVGAMHHVWGWRALSKVVERILQENSRP